MLVTHAVQVIYSQKDKENANYWPSDCKLLAICCNFKKRIRDKHLQNFNYKEIITQCGISAKLTSA